MNHEEQWPRHVIREEGSIYRVYRKTANGEIEVWYDRSFIGARDYTQALEELENALERKK